MLRIVIDTNVWIRILLRGRATLPVLSAWQAGQFRLVISQALLDEYDDVWQRPRLRKRIDEVQAHRLRRQMRARSEMVELGLDMTTRTIDLTDATQPLADYVEQVDGGSIVVTKNGHPIAAIVALPNTDLETAALSQNPQFLAIIERSRARYAQEGGISSAEMRRRLGVTPSQTDP